MHRKGLKSQEKVNKSITLLILKHDKDIITLIDESKSWKLVIQSLAVQLVKRRRENRNYYWEYWQGRQTKNSDNIAPETPLKYEMREYSFEIQITLMKHMNTKN